jgi:hypothetical protein
MCVEWIERENDLRIRWVLFGLIEKSKKEERKGN